MQVCTSVSSLLNHLSFHAGCCRLASCSPVHEPWLTVKTATEDASCSCRGLSVSPLPSLTATAAVAAAGVTINWCCCSWRSCCSSEALWIFWADCPAERHAKSGRATPQRQSPFARAEEVQKESPPATPANLPYRQAVAKLPGDLPSVRHTAGKDCLPLGARHTLLHSAIRNPAGRAHILVQLPPRNNTSLAEVCQPPVGRPTNIQIAC